jgi:hypothetical protein
VRQTAAGGVVSAPLYCGPDTGFLEILDYRRGP